MKTQKRPLIIVTNILGHHVIISLQPLIYFKNKTAAFKVHNVLKFNHPGKCTQEKKMK